MCMCTCIRNVTIHWYNIDRCVVDEWAMSCTDSMPPCQHEDGKMTAVMHTHHYMPTILRTWCTQMQENCEQKKTWCSIATLCSRESSRHRLWHNTMHDMISVCVYDSRIWVIKAYRHCALQLVVLFNDHIYYTYVWEVGKVCILTS